MVKSLVLGIIVPGRGYGWDTNTNVDGNRAIERCTFDQARLIRHNRILAKNGIAPDGT